MTRALTVADPAVPGVTMIRALGPSCIWARRMPLRHLTAVHATVLSGVDIPHHINAAALEWQNVQHQRPAKKEMVWWNNSKTGRAHKGPSSKYLKQLRRAKRNEQACRNECRFLVQKWIWEEHVNQQEVFHEVFQETMRIYRDEREWEAEEYEDSWLLSDTIKEVLGDLEHWPFSYCNHDANTPLKQTKLRFLFSTSLKACHHMHTSTE